MKRIINRFNHLKITTMKKMIVIAALIGGMLMPAQIMAQRNNRNEKPRVENRDNRKDMKPGNSKGGNKEMNFNKPGKKDKPGFAMNKPGKKGKPGKGYKKPGRYNYKYNRPAPPPVVVVNRPAPRPCPPPPPPAVVYRNCYDNDAAEAAVAVLGLAALVALIAN